VSPPSSLQLVVNGESRTLTGPATLVDVLRQLGLDPRAVVVEHNRVIVRRADLGGAPVRDGDVIEIVHFVGGG